MNTLAAGFWGAYFGTAALMFAASLAAFARSLRRVALMAGLSAVVSSMFVVGFLSLLPLPDPQAHTRLLAHVAVFASVALGLMLMSLLGLLRPRRQARWLYALMLGSAAVAVAAGWTGTPWLALALGCGMATAVALAMLAVAVRSARRGDRLGWVTVAGVVCMLATLIGLSWIALIPGQPWTVHAFSATSAVGYQAIMAYSLWNRYSYLLELSEVLAHGPSYDPVTRMRSYNEAGQMVAAAFSRRAGDTRAVGVIVVSIANLSALESLHGRAALNHALFVCASRLRRCVPEDVQMGRLTEDGFLLLIRDARDGQRVVALGRQLRDRLSRPVVLSTSRDPEHLDAGTTQWVADIGIGLLAAGAHLRPSQAILMTRAMSRTAWSYPSRLAGYDEGASQITQLPLAQE